LESRQSSIGNALHSRQSSLSLLDALPPGFVMHRTNNSLASIASLRSAGLDEGLMRELDQVCLVLLTYSFSKVRASQEAKFDCKILDACSD
jgi:hypothetical protein